MSLTKTEYLLINCDGQFKILLNEGITNHQLEKFMYMGAFIDKNGLGKKIKLKISTGTI